MSIPASKILRTLDRGLRIKCTLDENSFQLRTSTTHGVVQIEFTRGFARELRDFLTAADAGETNFGALE